MFPAAASGSSVETWNSNHQRSRAVSSGLERSQSDPLVTRGARAGNRGVLQLRSKGDETGARARLPTQGVVFPRSFRAAPAASVTPLRKSGVAAIARQTVPPRGRNVLRAGLFKIASSLIVGGLVSCDGLDVAVIRGSPLIGFHESFRSETRGYRFPEFCRYRLTSEISL